MKRQTRYQSAVLILLSLCLLPCAVRAGSIINSKHDLSVGGPGPIKGTREREVCIFCHVPHNASPAVPLWNHANSTATYIPYSSPTLKASVGQPNGASKLCLSCHDGTVAIGLLRSRHLVVEMQGGVTTMPAGSSNLGTDLSQDHPISFTYDAALAAAQGKLRDPSTLTEKVRLDANSQMQCTSCHNPHDDQYGKFLVMDNTGSSLCAVCHTDPAWNGSAHAVSGAPLSAALPMNSGGMTRAFANAGGSGNKTIRPQAKTVGQNGCKNCHGSHAGGSGEQLLFGGREERTCFSCHSGNVARENIAAEFNKRSVHPVLQTSNQHKAGEDIQDAPRHVSCSDCHNPHAAKSQKEPGNRVSGAIAGAKGMNRSGSIVETVSREYELCFRCHADNVNRGPATVNREWPETNTRQEFGPSSRSFHPVVDNGKNPNVPSLLPPYNAGSKIKCTDCHNNDQGPGAGGRGPAGPHGSAYAPLLERQLITTDHVGESPTNYALCYKCHSRDSILGDQSFRAFNSEGRDRGHRFHVVEQKAACTTCHDSHGSEKNKHLINFNPDYVQRSSNGRIEYNSIGTMRGNCTLKCHGADHVKAAYPDQLPNMRPDARMRHKGKR